MKSSIISIIILSVIWLSSCSGTSSNSKTSNAKEASSTNEIVVEQNTASVAPTDHEGVIQMTKAIFLEKVYDFEKNPKKWSYKGDKPCIIDFYADWCRPCKMVAPVMAEFAEKYKGKITVYKVNIDQEKDLAQFFGVHSIPTVFFCPVNADPQMTQGALEKNEFESIITGALLKK